MKKAHIISIVLIVALLGLGGFKYYSYKNPDAISGMTEAITAQNTVSVSPTVKNVSELPSRSSTISNSINIKTETPINGTYKGVIEVGASGFNAFVVDIDKDKNWELVTKEFGASLAYEGFANTSDVYQQMIKYITIITDKGVSGRNVHFVISSGALKNKKMDLIAQAIKEKGFTVNKVTADQEGKYALKALLPKNYRDNSFTVDIGSGNTKVSWFENGNMKTIELPGAKYYQNEPKISDQEVFTLINEGMKKVPASLKKNCFLIGGVPFKLASQSRLGNERFTALKNPDEYSGGDDIKVKSGINIYRGIYENAAAANFIFDWDANFTIGFLLSLN